MSLIESPFKIRKDDGDKSQNGEYISGNNGLNYMKLCTIRKSHNYKCNDVATVTIFLYYIIYTIYNTF